MASGRLGCAENTTAFVTFKCGAPRTCTLTNAANITWNRALDKISEAQIVIPIAIGAGRVNPCCDCLADMEPWCCELHIERDGVLVWSGPIVEIDYGYTQVTVHAQDYIGWLAQRVPLFPLVTATSPAMEITDFAVSVLDGAFAEDDPCVLRNIYQTDIVNKGRPTYLGPIQLDPSQFPAYEGTYFEWLQHLSDLGLDFVAIGRRIILSVDAVNLPIVGTLTDEDILGEISVKKDGFLMVNRAYVRYKDDDTQAQCIANAKAGKVVAATVPCPAIVDGPKYCYGPIEKIYRDSAAFNINTAKQIGQLYVNAGSIAPRTIEFPSGSKLSPNAPFDINQLIPGSRIKVAFSGLCLEVFRDFKLLEVGFNLQEGGDEEITVSLGPLNSPGTSG